MHILGNHTWSHPDLEWTDLDAYLSDVLRGAEALDSLLAPRGSSVVWFRHPLLHAGDTPGKKRGLARFLQDRGWRVAPVTVDNQEWVYAYVYHVALRRGETALATRVAEAFLDHLDGAFAYFERRSQEVVGREIDQVLLLHANRLVADHIDQILGLIQARGYTFIALATAVADPAYERGDPWMGEGGPSWIERWAAAGGDRPRQGPREHEPDLASALASSRVNGQGATCRRTDSVLPDEPRRQGRRPRRAPKTRVSSSKVPPWNPSARW